MLFSFHNEFDDVDVTFDNDDHTPSGPCTVTLIYGDRAISVEEPEVQRFATIAEGKARFLELVGAEIDSVLVDPLPVG